MKSYPLVPAILPSVPQANATRRCWNGARPVTASTQVADHHVLATWEAIGKRPIQAFKSGLGFIDVRSQYGQQDRQASQNLIIAIEFVEAL